MNVISLILSSMLLIIPIGISYREHLGLGKDIIISMLRAVIQLVIVGYILEFIFGTENPIFIIAIIIIMIMNAAINTIKRGEGIKNVFKISFISLIIGNLITLLVLVLSGAIEFTPNEVIPVAGMVVSNSMVAIGLSYKNINNSFRNRRDEVEVKLSLGSDINVAAKDIIRESIKLSIIPSIDSAKALGIVALPGMMTGLILAGSSPIMAIKFQIMVTVMILTASSISSVLATYMCYRYFFNDRKQLIIDKH